MGDDRDERLDMALVETGQQLNPVTENSHNLRPAQRRGHLVHRITRDLKQKSQQLLLLRSRVRLPLSYYKIGRSGIEHGQQRYPFP